MTRPSSAFFPRANWPRSRIHESKGDTRRGKGRLQVANRLLPAREDVSLTRAWDVSCSRRGIDDTTLQTAGAALARGSLRVGGAAELPRGPASRPVPAARAALRSRGGALATAERSRAFVTAPGGGRGCGCPPWSSP